MHCDQLASLCRPFCLAIIQSIYQLIGVKGQLLSINQSINQSCNQSLSLLWSCTAAMLPFYYHLTSKEFRTHIQTMAGMCTHPSKHRFANTVVYTHVHTNVHIVYTAPQTATDRQTTPVDRFTSYSQ